MEEGVGIEVLTESQILAEASRSFESISFPLLIRSEHSLQEGTGLIRRVWIFARLQVRERFKVLLLINFVSKVQTFDVSCPASGFFSTIRPRIATLSICFWCNSGSVGYGAKRGACSVKSLLGNSLLDNLVAQALIKEFLVLLIEQRLEPINTRPVHVPNNDQGLAECD